MLEPALVSPLPLAPLASRLRQADAPALRRHISEALAHAAALEPTLRALHSEPDRESRLLAEAEALAAQYPGMDTRPALYGVLAGVKDIVAVDGLETRAGSALPPDAFAMPEATTVRRLRAAGSLMFGKTVTAEFASMGPGATANPHHPGHTPGGSSSGSAAGVAAGYFPLAIGTQTGGSVIRPAAFCGIVGFKPSYGRIPTDGVVAHAPSLDTLGLFTQDAAGATLAASALLDGWHAANDATASSLTCAVPEGAYLELAEPAARTAFEETVARLATSGVTIVREPFMDDAPDVLQRHAWMQDAEFAEAHRDRFARFASLYTGSAAAQIDRGRRVTEAQYRVGVEGRLELRERLHRFLDDTQADILLCPSAPGPAPAGLHTTGDPRMNSPWTQAGVPAVSLPAGRVDGLPIGLQLVGRFGEDETLLAAAVALEPLLR